MNAPALVKGEELARLLHPLDPPDRATIYRWTVRGIIPRAAVVHCGRRIRYSVPQLVAAGWLPAPAAHAAHAV